jgi:hypothetical protein
MSKKIILNIIYFLANIWLGCIPVRAQFNQIQKYQCFFGVTQYKNQKVIVIRSYISESQTYYYGFELNSLKACLMPSSSVNVKPQTWQNIQKQFQDSPYIKAIKAAQKEASPIQDAGIQHGFPNENGIVLTIDLCPSHKSLDRIIFTSIISEFNKIKTPVPIGVSITGAFLNKHQADIDWLKEQEQKGLLDIVWINHTYNHNYDPKRPLKENFLLESGTNISNEIILLEQKLLEQKILFSPFFRFPGLVSSPKLVAMITEYGLIPIGSDAWLAKGQQPKNGAIVLIHGNGNEPLGVHDFLQLLQKEKDSVRHKEWFLYDLRDNIEEEFPEKKP